MVISPISVAVLAPTIPNRRGAFRQNSCVLFEREVHSCAAMIEAEKEILEKWELTLPALEQMC